jgi:hypothetical protein
MTPENTAILVSTTFGSFFLCAYSLELINKNPNYLSLPSICNYFILGFSSGAILTITKHMLKNQDLNSSYVV